MLYYARENFGIYSLRLSSHSTIISIPSDFERIIKIAPGFGSLRLSRRSYKDERRFRLKLN
jgi:hypothetical protein